MSLRNKRIVITGANGGLGRAVVETALAQGAAVLLLDLAFDEEWLIGLSGDVDAQTINLLEVGEISSAMSAFDEVTGVANLAGGFDMGPTVHETDDKLWSRLFAMNVDTVRNMCAVSVPKMLKAGGAIVNIGAAGATTGAPHMGAYTASKSVVMRLTESMSEELKSDGINVNAILPSVIDTPTNREAMPDACFSDWVTPQQLANVICFLLSDAASGVHGALVPVRGLA